MLKRIAAELRVLPLWMVLVSMMYGAVIAAAVVGVAVRVAWPYVAPAYRAVSAALPPPLVTFQLTAQRLNLSPQNGLGRIGWQASQPSILNNWAPTGLAANTMQMVAPSDNQGTVITGISATGFALGDVVYVCSENGTQDAGVVGLSNRDSRSLAANQIITPDSGVMGTQQQTTFAVPSGSCVPLMYTQPDPVNFAGTLYWVVLSPGARIARQVSQMTSWFPVSTIQNLTGTYNDFRVNNTDVPDGGPQGYSTTIAAASVGAVLPQATINVAATAGFAGPGAGGLIPITIGTTSGATSVLCSGTTSTSFTGCTGGAGTLTLGEAVAGGICEAAGSCMFDDYTPIVISTVDSTGVTLTGMFWAGNASPTGLGPVKVIYNTGPGPVVLKNLNGGSTSSDQFSFPTAADVSIPSGAVLMLWHPATAVNWTAVGQLPYAAGTGIALSTGNVFSVNLNGGVAQTCGAGSAMTSLSAAGIATPCSPFVNAAGANATLTGSTLGVVASPTFTNTTTQLFAAGPAVTATLAAGTTNNWNPTACTVVSGNCLPLNTFIRATTTGTATAIVTGMIGPGGGLAPGLKQTVCNFGPGNIEFISQSASSASGNKFFLPFTLSTTPTLALGYLGCVTFGYDNTGFYFPETGGAMSSHQTVYGPIPTLSGCGGSPTIVGTDSAGTVTEGTTATGCTVTFASAWDSFADAPSCQVTWQNGIPPATSVSSSAASLVVTNTSATGDRFSYSCTQTKN